jgi:hypothetical protein
VALDFEATTAVHVVAVFAVVYAAAKMNVLSAAVKKAKDSAVNWFGGYVRGKVAPVPLNYDRTYKGTFQGYFRYSNPPHEWFVDLLCDGIETKVPVMSTNLLTGVQHGTFVEIDTQILPGPRWR